MPDPYREPSRPDLDGFEDVPPTGSGRSPSLDQQIAARVSNAVAGEMRGVVFKTIVGIAVPALLAIGGAGVATYVLVQIHGERLDQAERDRARIERVFDVRLGRVEDGLDEALDIRGDLRAIKATVETEMRGMNRRLDLIEARR